MSLPNMKTFCLSTVKPYIQSVADNFDKRLENITGNEELLNNVEEETGTTMSLVAIATHMAINNNNRILIISTTDKEDKINKCFFEEQQTKKMRLGILGNRTSAIDSESGIEGIAKIARSNKLTAEMITNYTKVIFKDRLEVIFGAGDNNKIEEEYEFFVYYLIEDEGSWPDGCTFKRYTLPYVDKNEEGYKMEREECIGRCGTCPAYVVNMEDPDCSEITEFVYQNVEGMIVNAS